MANKFNANRYTSVESIPTGDATQVENITVIDENGKEVKKPRDSTDRQVLRGLRPAFFDPTDAQANMGFTVGFVHVPSKRTVDFKAFITSYNETFSCDWASENVFGRVDPIYMFKQNSRNITLALNIPASTESEAFENLNRVQDLVQFLYPTYSDTSNALTLSNSPLIRLKIMNLVTGQSHPKNKEDGKLPYSFSQQGQLGVIQNLTVNHNLDNPDFGVIQTAQGVILPRMIEINLNFSAIHEATLGWTSNGETQNFDNNQFPYGVSDGSSGNEYLNPADVVEFNSATRAILENTLDTLQEEAVRNEQLKQQAQARYAGLFGNTRKKLDKFRKNNQADRAENIDNRLRTEGSEYTERKRERLERRSERLRESSQGYEDLLDFAE